MSAIPSSDDAIDGYSNLEEYIFNTERDHDREVRTSLYLWRWQESEIRLIGNAIGTNNTEICVRAFSMGLKVLRNELETDIGRMPDLSMRLMGNIFNLTGDLEGEKEFEEKIHSASFGLDCSNDWEMGDRNHVNFRDSEYSELQDTFVDGMFFGPWIKRVVLALGLAESKAASGRVRERTGQMIEELDGKSKESLELMESAAKEFITTNYPKWKIEGIGSTDYRRLEEIVSIMDGEQAEHCEVILDELEGEIR